MSRLRNIIMWATIVLVVLLSVANMFLTIYMNTVQDKSVDERINTLLNKMSTAPTVIKGINGSNGENGTNGNTPVKGVDYFDGKDGQNGVNGQDGKNGADGHDGIDGHDGATPIIQCNTIENRWEVKYNGDDNWQILGDSPIRCTI